MGINGRMPFTELYECVQNELVREAASNQENKYKGFVNQVYLNDLPSALPEEFITKNAYITTVAEYTTGTVTVGSGTAYIQGAATAWTSADTNKLLLIDGYDVPYQVTYFSNTRFTFSASLTWMGDSGTGLSYKLFKNLYALASDFSYLATDNPDDPNVVNRYIMGSPVFLTPLDNADAYRQYVSVTGDLHSYAVMWLNESPYMGFSFAPASADIVMYHYIPTLTTLTEYTTGSVTFATSTAVLAGTTGSLWVANVNTALNSYYMRNDADGTGSSSKWHKILSITNDTALSLAVSFGGTTGTGQTYTISEISKWPSRFDDAILYRAALIADPDNVNMQKWGGLYQEAISMDKTANSKRNSGSPLKGFFGVRR